MSLYSKAYATIFPYTGASLTALESQTPGRIALCVEIFDELDETAVRWFGASN